MEVRQVQITDHGDGSADLTISDDEEDHSFSVKAADGHAVLSYEETLSWRGVIRVAVPPERVYKALMQSDELTGFLNNNDVDSVSRDRRP